MIFNLPVELQLKVHNPQYHHQYVCRQELTQEQLTYFEDLNKLYQEYMHQDFVQIFDSDSPEEWYDSEGNEIDPDENEFLHE